jgi:hypothetical protein
MALSDKNIIITPNIGQAADPKIQFIGADSSTGPQTITLNVYPTSGGMISFEGSSGQLFSITNSLTGTIYSVTDVSGVPSIEVLDSGLVKLAQYNGNVLIGTGTSDGTAKLQVSSVSRFGNIYVGYGTYKNSIRPVDDNNMNLDTPSGYTASATSLRAPVFYDVENTNYYVDPAAVSVLNDTRLANGNYQAIAGNVGQNLRWRALAGTSDLGFSFYDANDNWRMQLYASSGNYGFLNSNWGAWDLRKVPGGVLYMNNNDSYYLNAPSDSYMYRVYGAADTRSPIFYDLNNTGYYVNPDDLSRLNRVDPNEVYNYGWFRNHYNNYGLYNQANGTHFYSNGGAAWAITGSGGNVELQFRSNHESTMRGYVYANTGGSIGFLDYNGNWRIRGDGANVELYGGTYIDTGYAYIIYDRNDTAYYVDPRSTSRMSGLRLDGVDNNASGDDGILWINKPNNNDWAIIVGGSLEYGLDLRMAASHTYAIRTQANGGEYARWGSDYIYHSSSIRAPIFYDTNDTAYYVDPNSWSRLSHANIASAPSGRTLSLGGDQTDRVYDDGNRSSLVINAPYYPHIYINAVSNANNTVHGPVLSMTGVLSGGGYRRWGMGIANTDPDCFSWGYYDNQSNPHYGVGGSFGYTGTNSKMWLNTGGHLWSTGSMRAPIWYDSDNTGYYLDATASQSLRTAGDWRSDSGAWTGDFSGKIQYHSNHWYIQAYDYVIHRNSGGSNVFMTASNGDIYTALWSDWLTNQWRSSIFYDYNDSAYYCDPNGTSRFLNLTTVNTISGNISTADKVNSSSGYPHAGTGMFPFYNWGGTNGGGSEPNAGSYTIGISVGSHPGDQAYGFQIARNMWNTGLWTRGYDSGWGSWVRLLDSSNYTSYGDGRYLRENVWINDKYFGTDGLIYCNQSRPYIMYDRNDSGYYCDPNSTSRLDWVNANGLRTYSNLYIDNDYGRTIVGVYTSTRLQGVFAMGDSYKLPADGSNGGSLYGIAWSHPNAGGVAANLNTHGMLVMENGGFLAAVSGSIRARDDMRAPIFYDSNDTGYYLNPNGGSYLNSLTLAGGAYFRPQNWIQLDSTYGMYWPNHYGAHLHANDLSTYTQLAIRGSKNSYGGMYDQYSGVNGMMYDSSGNGGIYRESDGRWYIYHHLARNCLGVGTSTTDASWGLRCVKGGYFDGRVDASIYYDANDTTYYLDPNGTSNLSTTVTGVMYFRANRNTSSDSPPLQAYSNDGGGAIMSFHRGGQYAINFGLDSDNVIRFGGWSASANRLQMDMSGNLTMAGNVTAYSDERLKKDWALLPDDYVERLAEIKSGTYTRIDSEERQVGVSAQDFQLLLTEAVSEDNSGMLSVSYGNAALASSVELAKRIVKQQAEIDELKALVAQLLAK